MVVIASMGICSVPGTMYALANINFTLVITLQGRFYNHFFTHEAYEAPGGNPTSKQKKKDPTQGCPSPNHALDHAVDHLPS